MKKLNQKKIKWTIKEIERRDMGVWTIAHQNNITPRWARELPRKYKDKEIVLKKPGRRPKSIPSDERKLVIDTYKEYLVGATMIERILDEKGRHIGHNKIHKILLEAKLAKHESNKQERRKYRCYQRRHSNSLWHTDWFQYKRKWYILFEDDASRFVTGNGEFPNRSSDNAWKVFNQATKEYGIPKQLHSDNDSTFKANKQDEKNKAECDYQMKVKKAGVKQIFAKRGHPRSNGKNEKLNGTIKRLMKKGLSFKGAVKHYNFKKPHWALDTPEGKLRTPYQAFLDKMRK
jgi:transposase InsO family protein